MNLLHEDRLFPSDPDTRAVARRLYAEIRELPIVSPHGHTQAAWFAHNEPFPDPAKLFVQPDHYVFRMLYSQGVLLDELEIGTPELKDPRRVWRIFAEHYYLFRGAPTRMWLDYAFQELFGITERLSGKNADFYYDTIAEKLHMPEFLPRALYERFRLEVLATTDSPLDSLNDHQTIRDSGWNARIIPTFRPDPVVDPEFAGFRKNIARLGEMTGEDTRNSAKDGAPLFDRGDNTTKTWVGKYDARRGFGHISGSGNGDANLRLTERRSVIGTISTHGDRVSGALKCLYEAEFLLRENARVNGEIIRACALWNLSRRADSAVETNRVSDTRRR